MLVKIKQFFSSQLALDDNQNHSDPLQLAAAALLIELSRADYHQDAEEQRAIEEALKQSFNLEQQQLDELVALAEAQNQEATSLYQFTSLINDHYSPEQRFELIKMLWQVAVADGEISKYEDHLIRKIADLIYVPHSEFIRAKLTVVTENSANS